MTMSKYLTMVLHVFWGFIKGASYLLQKFLLFLLLVLRQLLRVVNLPLLLALNLFRVGAEVSVDGHLIGGEHNMSIPLSIVLLLCG